MTPMKKQKSSPESPFNQFEVLSEEIVFVILDFLEDNPLDKKSFSLVCRSFYAIESRQRKILKPLLAEHLKKLLRRYPFVSKLDLSSCPRITDTALSVISFYIKGMLSSINLSRSVFFSHLGLSNLVMSCGNLVEIDLSNATELKDTAAAAITEAKNLEKLWLARCKSITDIGIVCIAVGCKKLKVLCLKWCLGVGDLGVGIVAVKCKDLRYLDLSFLQITDKCLPQISELEHLEELVLEGCFSVEDKTLGELKPCKALDKLDMSNCHHVSHVGLSSLASAAPRLKQLILSYTSCVDSTLADRLHKFSMLQSVKFDGCEVTCSGLKSVGNWCASLRELSLSKCAGVLDEGLAFLVNKHKDLRKLDITCCRKITQVSLSHIMSSCTSLTSLKMESCTSVLADAFLSMGEQCPFLEELDLTDNEIDDEGLESISRCSQLLSLKLGICLNITDKGLIHIGKGCSKIKELDLYRSAGITDSGILAISHGCPDLEMVNTAYCEFITDHSLISLSKCSKLNTLEIRGCTRITSSGLAAIAEGCRQLAKLDIKKCPNVDDSGMTPHSHFSQNLKQINLSYTAVSDMGLLSLARISCLKSMTVLHLHGLTPNGIAATLLACGGLTKVKLHSSFKSSLPYHFFEHLEARGCTFQWRDKVFKAELDPKCWKLQLDEWNEANP